MHACVTSPPTRVVWIEIKVRGTQSKRLLRHHPHGWCGLKCFSCRAVCAKFTGHHPHGWCGLKSFLIFNYIIRFYPVTTHTGGVDWNKKLSGRVTRSPCHHPHGWCGLKSSKLNIGGKEFGHHPHGWCGLKFNISIEILSLRRVTTHTGGVDWNL